MRNNRVQATNCVNLGSEDNSQSNGQRQQQQQQQLSTSFLDYRSNGSSGFQLFNDEDDNATQDISSGNSSGAGAARTGGSSTEDDDDDETMDFDEDEAVRQSCTQQRTPNDSDGASDDDDDLEGLLFQKGQLRELSQNERRAATASAATNPLQSDMASPPAPQRAQQHQQLLSKLGETTFVLDETRQRRAVAAAAPSGAREQQHQRAISPPRPANLCEYDSVPGGCKRQRPSHFEEFAHPNRDALIARRIATGEIDVDEPSGASRSSSSVVQLTQDLGLRKQGRGPAIAANVAPLLLPTVISPRRNGVQLPPQAGSPGARKPQLQEQQRAASGSAQRLASGSLDEDFLLFGRANSVPTKRAAAAAAAPAAAASNNQQRGARDDQQQQTGALGVDAMGRPVKPFPSGAKFWARKAQRERMAERIEEHLVSRLACDERLFECLDPFIGRKFDRRIAERRDELATEPACHPVWLDIPFLRYHAADEVAVEQASRRREQRRLARLEEDDDDSSNSDDGGGDEDEDEDDRALIAAATTVSPGIDPLARSESSGRVLRPYQITGVNVMLRNFSRGLGTLMCDDMGLGKTCQTVVFLAALHARIGLAGPHLIVCPLSTLSSWAREIQRWAPALAPHVVMYRGAAAHRATMQVPGPKIFIVTPATFNSDASFFCKVRFGVVIIDEAQITKNDDSLISKHASRLRACGRLLLSGTPVSNTAAEVWSLMGVLQPAMARGLEKPERGNRNGNRQAMRDAAALLRRLMVRRNKLEVLRDIPRKVVHASQPVEPAPVQRMALERCIRRSPEVPAKMLRNFAQQCLKLNNHPHMFTILAARRNPPRIAPAAWQRGEDLIRRRGFAMTPGLEALLQSGVQLAEEEIVHPSAKMLQLDALLQHVFSQPPDADTIAAARQQKGSAAASTAVLVGSGERHVTNRVLVFSQFTSMIDILEGFCVLRGYRYERLCGASLPAERELSMARFNHPSSVVRVFLITTTAGGVGITLTGANHVVFYDTSWNPQSDLQAADRAHRIGQTRVVHVHRLAVAGSVEENILQRSARKLRIAEFVTDGVQHDDLMAAEEEVAQNDADADDAAAAAAAAVDAVDESGFDCDALSSSSSEDDSDSDSDMRLAKRLSRQESKLAAMKKDGSSSSKKATRAAPAAKKAAPSASEKALVAAAKQLGDDGAATTTESIKTVVRQMLANLLQSASDPQSASRQRRRGRDDGSQEVSSMNRDGGSFAAAGDEEEDENDALAAPMMTQQQRDEKRIAEQLVTRMFEAMGANDDDGGGGGGTAASKAAAASKGPGRGSSSDELPRPTLLAQSVCFGCDAEAHPTRLLHCSVCVKSYHMQEGCLFGKDPPRVRTGDYQWKCPRHVCCECSAQGTDMIAFCCTSCPRSFCVDCLPAKYLSLEGSADGYTLPLISTRYPLMEEEGMTERRVIRYIGTCDACAERLAGGSVQVDDDDDDDDVVQEDDD